MQRCELKAGIIVAIFEVCLVQKALPLNSEKRLMLLLLLPFSILLKVFPIIVFHQKSAKKMDQEEQISYYLQVK